MADPFGFVELNLTVEIHPYQLEALEAEAKERNCSISEVLDLQGYIDDDHCADFIASLVEKHGIKDPFDD